MTDDADTAGSGKTTHTAEDTVRVRKVDPLGKRALFAPPVDPPDPTVDGEPLVGGEAEDGKEALYSTGPHRAGTVVFACSDCGTRTRMSAIEAGVRILWLTLWVPGRRFNRFIQCPVCQRHTWSRIEWFA